MLKFNLQTLLHLRGVRYPRRFLVGLGLSQKMAGTMLRGEQSSLRLEHLEMLCRALRCTPNDLLEWVPDEGGVADSLHPLHALAGRSAGNSLIEKLHSLSVEELQRLTLNG